MMRFILILVLVLGIAYFFFQPTFDSLFGKVSGTYDREVESVNELSE